MSRRTMMAAVTLAMALTSGLLWQASWAEPPAADTAPRVIALKFHADWCGSCKAMGSVYEELQEKFDQQPVLWIVLDHTREYNRRQSAYLAAALSLDSVWAEHGGKTGFILLVDAASHEVVDKLTADLTLKQMGARVTEAVGKTGA